MINGGELKGDQLPQSKLNEKLVSKILKERNEAIQERERLNKKIHAKELSKEYGVHVRTIEKLINGHTWGHVQ